MKMIKFIGVVFAVLVMVGFNTDVMAGYADRTEVEQANIDTAGSFAGYSSGESYYNARENEIIAKLPAEIRRARINIIMEKLYGDVTNEQLTQIEAIIP